MIKTYLFADQNVREDVPLDDWRSLIEGGGKLLWVDVREYSPEDMDDLARRFGLHAVAVESCLDGYRRPHIYEFPDHFYVNLTLIEGANGRRGHITPTELHLFAGEGFVLTLSQEKQVKAVELTLGEYRGNPGMASRGAMHTVYLLMEDLIEGYYPVVEQLDDDADALEAGLLHQADERSLAKLTDLKRRGFELRKLLGPQRDVLSELSRRDFRFMGASNNVYFQDLYNRMIRIFDMMDTIREILSGSLDIYLSTVSNRLNEIMKILTMAAAILGVLTLFTGFFGMNFSRLPWLDSPYAFRNSLIVMGLATAVMVWWFRRKRWM